MDQGAQKPHHPGIFRFAVAFVAFAATLVTSPLRSSIEQIGCLFVVYSVGLEILFYKVLRVKDSWVCNEKKLLLDSGVSLAQYCQTFQIRRRIKYVSFGAAALLGGIAHYMQGPDAIVFWGTYVSLNCVLTIALQRLSYIKIPFPTEVAIADSASQQSRLNEGKMHYHSLLALTTQLNGSPSKGPFYHL